MTGSMVIAILAGLLLGTAVLLWSGSNSARLRALLVGPGDEERSGAGRASGGAMDPAAEVSDRVRISGEVLVSDEQLAFDLDLVSICLTSGLPIPVALALAADATGDRSGLDRIARSLTIGGQEPVRDDRLLPVLEVLEFSERTGVGPAPLIESVAKELRDSSRRRRQEAAAALGVRLVVPLGLCILPAFLLLSVVPVVISLVSELTTVFF